MKKLTLLAIAILFAGLSAQAQSFYSFEYSTALPTGSLSKYTSAYSWRGVAFSQRYAKDNNLSFGFDFSWNVFYEKMENASFEYRNSTVTGNQYRYDNSFAFLLGSEYNFTPFGKVQYFAGLGAGTTRGLRALDIGQYRFSVNTWHFAVRPQVGLYYNLGAVNALKVSASYLQNFKVTDKDAYGCLAFNVGFLFR